VPETEGVPLMVTTLADHFPVTPLGNPEKTTTNKRIRLSVIKKIFPVSSSLNTGRSQIKAAIDEANNSQRLWILCIIFFIYPSSG
jgi:hypothetical protein